MNVGVDIDGGGSTIDKTCITEYMYISSSCELLGDTFSDTRSIHKDNFVSRFTKIVCDWIQICQ